ncbi:hypothetical protein [Arenivirga flava]|nr:hypothetical protein [Arenivirga flava]
MLLRRAAAPIALFTAVAFAGCTAPEPEPEPTVAPPTDEPIFASEEEALAAAEEVYRAYVKVIDDILKDGGAEPERLDRYAIGQAAELQKAGFAEALSSGVRSQGETTFVIDKLQHWSGNPSEGSESIAIFVCQDVSATDLVNADGKSVSDPGRPPVLPFEIGLTSTASGALVVSRDELWRGPNFC